MNESLRNAFDAEMNEAKRQYAAGDYRGAFHHLERAHVLGQRFVVAHTRAHWWMLRVALTTRNVREIVGQVIRIPVGVLGSAIGVVPVGNTGGSNVPATMPMPIPDDLKRLLR